MVSFVSPEKLKEYGYLHPLMIWGFAETNKDGKGIKSMKNNKVFVDFMHKTIKEKLCDIDEFIASAKKIKDGWLHVKDKRKTATKDDSSNLIASFQVSDSLIKTETYHPNPDYELFNGNGFFCLHPGLEKKLYSEIENAIKNQNAYPFTVEDLIQNSGHLPFFLANTSDTKTKVVSLIEMRDFSQIPNKLRVGFLSINPVDGRINNFKANDEFQELLHSIIKNSLKNNLELQDAACRHKNGSIMILEKRNRENSENLSSEDLIGTVEIKNGEIVEYTYQRNSEHRLLSKNGFFRPEDYFLEKIKNEIQNIEKQFENNDTKPQKKKRSWFKK